MARSIWKGAISFGLVHIPVSLQSATSTQKVNFDWLDERTMDPVGYKRINKSTGKPIASEHIVKGVQYEKGQYVIISEKEIKKAHPKATQTIEIFAFVDYSRIPLINFRKPYFLNPERRGEKVYALLRETLVKTKKVALAYVVIHTRQHLAALLPRDSAMVLMLLRWPGEMRSVSSLNLNDAVVDPDITAKEKAMAERLVEDMASDWIGDDYRNTFDENIMALVEEKASAGKIATVHESGESPDERKSADIVDLTELLKRSLGKKASEKPKAKSSKAKGTTKKAATKTRKPAAAKG